MPHLMIVSDDPVVGQAFAELIGRELGLQTTVVADAQLFSASFLEGIDAILTTIRLNTDWAIPVLTYLAGNPRNIHDILADVSMVIFDRKHGRVALTGQVLLDATTRMLEHVATEAVQELTAKEQALLLFLKQVGEASREEILKHVWGLNAEVTTHTLETHIYRLRQKWRELAETDCICATERGYGWCV